MERMAWLRRAFSSSIASHSFSWLRGRPIEDAFARNGRLLANGRFIHDMLLTRIKAPEASHAPWDYYDITGTVPATEAFRGAAETGCKLK